MSSDIPTTEENFSESSDTPQTKKRGKPINPDRHLPDGTYNNKPLDPDYFKKYYMEKTKGKVQCSCCGSMVEKSGIARHKRSSICAKKSALKETVNIV